jgi:hypothetical protein
MGKLDATMVANGPEGAVSAWDAVDWRQAEDDVRRLRRRIFTASQAGDLRRVRVQVSGRLFRTRGTGSGCLAAISVPPRLQSLPTCRGTAFP